MWCTAQHKGRPTWPVSKTWSFSTVCENLRWKRPQWLRNHSLKKSNFNGSKLRSYFSPFVYLSSSDKVSRLGRDRSLQRRFPILISCSVQRHSQSKCEVIRNRAQKAWFSAPKFFGGRIPNFGPIFKIAPISDHVAKFCSDWPRECRDLTLNKKRKEKKQQQNIRAEVALSQWAALTLTRKCKST